MKSYKKLLLGVVATLSIFATATPAFASTGKGGMSVSHKDYSTSISGQTTTTKSTTQATQATSTREVTQSLSYGFNAINNDPNQIYFANKQGVKQTGWIKADDGWHYADSSGKLMRNKWFKDTDSGKWYFFNTKSQMVHGMNVGSYYLATDGSWQGDARTGAVTYSKEGIGSDVYTVEEVESMISNGKVKVNVAHGSAIGATQDGTGVLILYLAN